MRQRTEEHYTIVLEPFGKYYAHITPSSGKAEDIAKCIWQKLQHDSIDSEKLLFIGCDGTNVNTGCNNGNFVFCQLVLKPIDLIFNDAFIYCYTHLILFMVIHRNQPMD